MYGDEIVGSYREHNPLLRIDGGSKISQIGKGNIEDANFAAVVQWSVTDTNHGYQMDELIQSDRNCKGCKFRAIRKDVEKCFKKTLKSCSIIPPS